MATLPRFPAATILYVESNQAHRMVLAQLLRDRGFRVLEAETGREGLRLAEERPDLILLEVHPPDADGFDLCGRFKATPATASAPVLLFSGVHVKSEDRIRGLESGADGYLIRPIEPTEVLAHIRAMLRVRRGEEAQARLSAIVEWSEAAIIGKSLDGKITSWNAGAERLFGFAAAEALGQPISLLAPPDRPDEMPGILERVRRGEGVEPFETVRVRKDGSRVDVSVSVSPVKDAAGRVVGASKIAHDISDRKRAEEEAQRLARHIRLLLDSTGEGVYGIDTRGRCTFINRAGAEMLGFDPDEVMGLDMHALIHHTRKDGSPYPPEECPIFQAFRDGKTARQDDEIIWRKDGTYFPVQYSSYPIQEAGIRGAVVTFNDITERSRAEEVRRRLQADRDDLLDRLQTQIERMPLARITFDADFRVTDWNPAAERIFGFRKEESLGRGLDLLVPPEVLAGVGGARLRRLRAGEMTANGLNTNRTKAGRTITCEWFNTPLMDEAGRFTGLLSLARDVTDSIAAEEALRLRDRAIQAVTQGILITDVSLPDNPIIYASAGFEKITGYAADEVVGRNCRFLQGPDTDASTVALVREAVHKARPCSVEILNYRKDGAAFWNSLAISPVRDAEGTVTHFVGVQADVTERKRMEEGLRLFRALIDQTMDGIEVIDPETGRYLDVNERACVTHGYTREEYLSLSVPDIDPQVASRTWAALIAQHRLAGVQSFEGQHRRKDGSTFPVEINFNYISLDRDYLVAVVRDVTERKQLEDQFRQAQKMEAVGQLAGGVAHDFNNLLQVITGYGELLLGTLWPDDPSRELVEEMTRAGERAAGLTRQLLAFSRQTVLAPRVLDLNSVVIDVEKMLRRVIGEDIDLRTALQPGLGRVKADPGQIEQVLMNLAVNARDAMPQGGKLTIETRDAELDEEYARLHTGVRPGQYVLLAVSDTGHGMTPEVQAHIFEPFFTTKELGKGTGLGLATVFGIVQQAGGHVSAVSEPGVGTTFNTYLPRVEESVSAVESRSAVPAAPTGTETVLLVEDEDAVRALARIVLQGAGYRVLEAADGGEALAVAGRCQEPIHLLMSDVVMPVLGGRELAERLLALHPKMKILFQSGYTDDAMVRHGVLQDKVHFLQKPYSPAALARKVREVLDSSE